MGLVINITLDEFTPLEGNDFVIKGIINNKECNLSVKLDNNEVYEGRLKHIVEALSTYHGIDNIELFVTQDEFENKILFDLNNTVNVKIYEIKSKIFDLNLIK
mgnify:CR=1 FL=1